VRRQSTVSMILFILKSETIPYIKYFILYVNLLLLTKIYVKNHFFFLLFYLFYFIILCINKIKIIYSQIWFVIFFCFYIYPLEISSLIVKNR
jgi:hypothetical protein